MSPTDVSEDAPLRVFCDLLSRNAQDYGDMLAVVYGDDHLTWSDVDTSISQVANSLLREYPSSGAQRAGMVPAPISTRFVGREIRHVFETGKPSLCVTSVHYMAQVSDAFPDASERTPLVVVDGQTELENRIKSWGDFIDDASDEHPVLSITSQDLSVQLFTGGTTGLPKGTNFTHQALLDACTLIPDHGLQLIFDGQVPESALLPTDHELKFLVPTPLYHLSGFMPAIIMAAMKKPVVFPKSLSFEPQEILELIERERITAVFMVPTQFRMLLDFPKLDSYDMTSVTLLSSGGSKMPAYMKKEILKRFPNTGAAIYSFLTVDDIPKITEGYIGKPISGVEMRVVNEAGENASPGEIGEAIYRSPSLMRGYHDDESTTKDSFDGTWFRTGDLFKIDEDGNYYYVERKSEVIFSGGEKVFPAEVEDLLSQHPDIDSAVIVGIPDRTWGEVVRAFVVLRTGSKITEEDILGWCSGKMASYKKPKEVIIRDSLPIAEDGKILRSALKELDSE
jgi:acyl-CoA synthetase (AMP-forming)/AMP-acid ligase II